MDHKYKALAYKAGWELAAIFTIITIPDYILGNKYLANIFLKGFDDGLAAWNNQINENKSILESTFFQHVRGWKFNSDYTQIEEIK